MNSLAMILLAQKKNKSIGEYIIQTQDNPENLYFSQISKRMFYIFKGKQVINTDIDFRCENMIMKKGMFDDVLDYCSQISQEWLQEGCEPHFKDILKTFNPNDDKSFEQIKMMYPITHSIGFIQALTYLYDINKIKQRENASGIKNHQEKDYHRRQKVKAAIRFLRDFKTSTHQYTK